MAETVTKPGRDSPVATSCMARRCWPGSEVAEHDPAVVGRRVEPTAALVVGRERPRRDRALFGVESPEEGDRGAGHPSRHQPQLAHWCTLLA